MEKILRDLDIAFGLISSVSVSGEAVDKMAAAKQRLREAFTEVKKLTGGKTTPEKETESDGG